MCIYNIYTHSIKCIPWENLTDTSGSRVTSEDSFRYTGQSLPVCPADRAHKGTKRTVGMVASFQGEKIGGEGEGRKQGGRYVKP